MIVKHLNLIAKNSVNPLINLVRTKIHPIAQKVEFIHGKTSKVGTPAALDPIRMELEKGKSYSWCSCGKSSKQPFCDGSHKKLNAELKEDEPKYQPLRFTAEESRTVLFCLCKSSSNRPFCDQTHELIKKKKKKTFMEV